MATSGVGTDLQTMAELAALGAQKFGDRPAQRFKVGDEWKERSYAELADEARAVALGLVDLGVAPGDRVCVLANTRPEWTIVELAIWMAGAVVVPIYQTNSPEECEWVAGNSGAVAVFCEDEAQLDKIRAVRERLPELEHLILIDGTRRRRDLARRAARARARRRPRRARAPRRGRQARRRDAVHLHLGHDRPAQGLRAHARRTRASLLRHALVELEITAEGDVVYLYLPLAHVFAQLIEIARALPRRHDRLLRRRHAPDRSRDPAAAPRLRPVGAAHLREALRRSPRRSSRRRRPSSGAVQQAIKLGVKVRDLENHGKPVPDELRKPFEQADEAIFKGVRALFGGRMREATTGAAPIAQEILEFFYAAGCPVLEGYGMTETMGVDDHLHAREPQVRHRRAADARRRGQDRR